MNSQRCDRLHLLYHIQSSQTSWGQSPASSQCVPASWPTAQFAIGGRCRFSAHHFPTLCFSFQAALCPSCPRTRCVPNNGCVANCTMKVLKTEIHPPKGRKPEKRAVNG